MTDARKASLVRLDKLRPHPRNYKAHPEDQLEHLAASLRENGQYKNVVAAKDLTVLAGHGLVMAAQRAGLESVLVVRMPWGPEDPRSLKLLALDNEVQRRAETDDRQLTELLKEISEQTESGLLGTGFDEAMLANLVFITRTEAEVGDLSDAEQWVGLPSYTEGEKSLPQLLITFPDEEFRQQFLAKLEHDGALYKKGKLWTTRYPSEQRHDWKSVRFEGGEEGG